jgi:hypothetical protein
MEYLNTTFSPTLPFRELCIGEVRERKARLSDVFLESPTVGLLGLRIFELPAVGLPKFNQHLPGTARVEFGEEEL